MAAAQTPAPPPPLDYEAVSIKRNTSGVLGGSGRLLPDGTRVIVNMAVRQFISSAAPVDVDEIEGLPDWAFTERYDVTAKPPEGSTREQRLEMWRRMLADRLKLAGHIEERERDVFDLVLARADGQLGPNLKPSSVDCSSPTTRPAGMPSADEMLRSCGVLSGVNRFVTGSATLDELAGNLRGMVGGRVMNRTGLTGNYTVDLSFSQRTADSNGPADPPDILTALQEQLGLKVIPRKAKMPVFVVDRIERPSEN